MSTRAKDCPACGRNVPNYELNKHIADDHDGGQNIYIRGDDGNFISLSDALNAAPDVRIKPTDADYAPVAPTAPQDPFVRSGLIKNEVINAKPDVSGTGPAITEEFYNTLVINLSSLIGESSLIDVNKFTAALMLRLVLTDANPSTMSMGSVLLEGQIERALDEGTMAGARATKKRVTWTAIDAAMTKASSNLDWEYTPRKMARFLGPMIRTGWNEGTLFDVIKANGTSLSQRLGVKPKMSLACLSFFNAIVPPDEQTVDEKNIVKHKKKHTVMVNESVEFITSTPELTVTRQGQTSGPGYVAPEGERNSWTQQLREQDAANQQRYGMGWKLFQKSGRGGGSESTM